MAITITGPSVAEGGKKYTYITDAQSPSWEVTNPNTIVENASGEFVAITYDNTDHTDTITVYDLSTGGGTDVPGAYPVFDLSDGSYYLMDSDLNVLGQGTIDYGSVNFDVANSDHKFDDTTGYDPYFKFYGYAVSDAASSTAGSLCVGVVTGSGVTTHEITGVQSESTTSVTYRPHILDNRQNDETYTGMIGFDRRNDALHLILLDKEGNEYFKKTMPGGWYLDDLGDVTFFKELSTEYQFKLEIFGISMNDTAFRICLEDWEDHNRAAVTEINKWTWRHGEVLGCIGKYQYRDDGDLNPSCLMVTNTAVAGFGERNWADTYAHTLSVPMDLAPDSRGITGDVYGDHYVISDYNKVYYFEGEAYMSGKSPRFDKFPEEFQLIYDAPHDHVCISAEDNNVLIFNGNEVTKIHVGGVYSQTHTVDADEVGQYYRVSQTLSSPGVNYDEELYSDGFGPALS